MKELLATMDKESKQNHTKDKGVVNNRLLDEWTNKINTEYPNPELGTLATIKWKGSYRSYVCINDDDAVWERETAEDNIVYQSYQLIENLISRIESENFTLASVTKAEYQSLKHLLSMIDEYNQDEDVSDDGLKQKQISDKISSASASTLSLQELMIKLL